MSNEFAERLAIAIRSSEALPTFESGLSLDDAYQLQHRVTAIRSPGQTGGVKAGVTAAAAQKFFGLDHALIASLYSDSLVSSGSTLSHVEGRQIESELALKLNSDGEPVAIAPALEIVAVRFADSKQLTASNLVACNLGADLYVVGEFLPWDEAFNNTSMVLRKNNDVVNEASMSDALGGPLTGAKWIHQEALSRGFSLDNETIFMMGACGAVVPAESGRYVGEYGSLGTVEVVIE